MAKKNKAKTLVVGLTGGIGTGKTSVLRRFEMLGVKTISCDDISRELFYRKDIAAKIKKEFNTLDRKKIARVIFSSRAARARLEKIMHPPIFRELKGLIKSARSKKAGIVVVDAPLLFEAEQKGMFEKVIVVWCPKKIQVKRLAARDGISLADAERKARAQMPLSRKLKMADYVVDNSRGFSILKRDVRKILDKLSQI